MEFSEYIEGFVKPDNPVLEKIIRDIPSWDNMDPTVGTQVGRMLGWLIQSLGARRVLEFGPCLGYSTIYLAEALKVNGGMLVSIEKNEDYLKVARANLAGAGLAEYVEFIAGDASEVIHRIEGPFDLIFQDSDKTLYPDMLERCIELVSKGGIIAADDALFKPMGIRQEMSDPVHRYIQRIFADDRLYSTILPIGDGLAISFKLKD